MEREKTNEERKNGKVFAVAGAVAIMAIFAVSLVLMFINLKRVESELAEQVEKNEQLESLVDEFIAAKEEEPPAEKSEEQKIAEMMIDFEPLISDLKKVYTKEFNYFEETANEYGTFYTYTFGNDVLKIDGLSIELIDKEEQERAPWMSAILYIYYYSVNDKYILKTGGGTYRSIYKTGKYNVISHESDETTKCQCGHYYYDHIKLFSEVIYLKEDLEANDGCYNCTPTYGFQFKKDSNGNIDYTELEIVKTSE